MRNSSKYICPTSPTCSKTVSRRKGFTLLELIVVVVTIGILALMAIASFSGVINNTSASTVDATAASIARDAKVISAFNPGSLTNVVSDANVDVAVAEAALDASAGWVVDTSSTEGASISLTKNGKTCSTTITVAAGTVSASDASCGAASGSSSTTSTTTPPVAFALSYASTAFSLSQTSQTRAPSVSGGTASSFSYTGTLPTGVSFNTSTGVFTGPSAWNFQAAQISAGSSHTCALTTSGGVKCWGDNYFGQLGDGTNTQRNTPVDVSGLTSGVAQISAGGHHTCAVTTGGGAKCWGFNSNGRLGDGTATDRNTPVDVVGLTSGVAQIHSARYQGTNTCALTTGGGAKCWGGGSGNGDGTNTERRTPVDVSGLTSGVASISVGLHTCAVTTSGGAKCWGVNNYSELGDGTDTHRNAPVDVVGLTSGVTHIEAGHQHTCALTTSGGVKCWGRNDAGQLGDGTTTDRSAPGDVSGLTSGVASISTTIHTCALTTSGGVKCWGRNVSGQLGDGTMANRSTPVNVSGLTSGVAQISVGVQHTCALTASGGAKCWGGNWQGYLGDGTDTQRLGPVDVSGLTGNPGWPANIIVTATSSTGSTANANVSLINS